MEIYTVRQRSNLGSGIAVGCLVGVLVACGLGGAAVYALVSSLGLTGEESLFAGVGPLVEFFAVALLIALGHVAASVAAYRIRPGRLAVILTQAPFPPAYVALIVCWQGTWSPWYIAWPTAAGSALAWLTVWYLAAPPAIVRRALVYLVALAVLVAANVAGVLAVIWRQTDGLGLRGQPTPWTAFESAAATSCLSDVEYHWRGDRLVLADCQSDTSYSEYDRESFDELICSEQPKSAFGKWWQWSEERQMSFILFYMPISATVDGKEIPIPLPEEQEGSKAELTYEVSIKSAFPPGQIQLSDYRETWKIRAETVSLGGWKVCGIDIVDPIELVD